jgi:hypothetical protein
MALTGPTLHFSGTAVVTNCDPSTLYDHWNFTAAFGVGKHFLKSAAILNYVQILEFLTLLLVIPASITCIGSSVFSENQSHCVCHSDPPVIIAFNNF